MLAEPAITTGNANSNMCNSGMPRRADTSATSRLVDVPIVVAMPPMMVEKPMGISTSVTGICVRMQTATSTGSIIATRGVLFMNMLPAAAANMAKSKPPLGLRPQTLASARVIVCKAPVTSSALEQIRSATMVINAVLPNPARNVLGPSRPESP